MKIRWRELIISFLMALALWYGVSGSEKIESQVDVRVDYRGLPTGLVVRSGMINKVSVRVRASVGMINAIAGRDYAFYIDLSEVHKGENTLPISVGYLPFRSGVEVIDITPSRITLQVDSIESKTVPVIAVLSGNLPQDHIAQATFNPTEVTLSGPSALIESMDSLEVPIAIAEPVIPGATEVKRLLPLPEGLDATPSEVTASIHIGIKRKLVTVTRTVAVSTPAGVGKFVRPDKVTLSVAMPESLAPKAASNSGIKASASLDSTELGSYTVPVHVSLPEGAEIVSIKPPQVTITLEQKQP